MTDQDRKNLIAQWAFDTRPVLARFHLWLENVEFEQEWNEPNVLSTFAPAGIRRCLGVAAAVTALGTRLFGSYGEGAGKEKAEVNQIKKTADAISAYVMSESLWYLTRNIPENHAVMVSLGEGLMPKAGESPEMGANPQLGFGRVYARPAVAKFVDDEVHRLLNEPDRTWDDFYAAIRARGITIWGAAVDTLENTSRFAKGAGTGPMSVLHVFDQPLTVSRPYESYMGSLTIPRAVKRSAEETSVLIDFLTPRAKVVEAIEATYPGIERHDIHVWTLGGESRATRLGRLWDEWRGLGVHLVEEGWVGPTQMPVFTESGTYAPNFMVGDWEGDNGARHVFLCDGYAASAEAMQAASLSDVLDVDVSMSLYSPKFGLPHDEEYRIMHLDPDAPGFGEGLARLLNADVDAATADYYRSAIREAVESNMPVGERVLRADDFFPEKQWQVLAALGYMCPDPYTGIPGVTQVAEDTFEVTSVLATRRAQAKIKFTLRLMETMEQSRLVFSPLLVRFTSGEDYRSRPVKISDSGRIRNELQTMLPQALEYEGDKIRVRFDRMDDTVIPPDKQKAYREILQWYKDVHPTWFGWLDLA
ncbi:MAG: hypothetical protein IT198_01405 [Acidimicrobiia bacterium]|nr:hypothetical protein [Acidimicrobiia bacterium]